MIKKIGVLTSGGDAPGMNAAIRSIVKTGYYEGLEVYGIKDGYLGLFKNKIIKLNFDSVSNIINKGGTFLGSARFPEFCQENIRFNAIKNMTNIGLDALIVIGGNGSYIGAKYLIDSGFPCIALPGTIDNDIIGTDYTIGYSTALETIVEAVDRLRDTSLSHKRISIIETMGRNCGNLTITAAIAGGCEFAIIPEFKFNSKDLINKIKINIENGQKNIIVLITENICNVNKLSKEIEKETGKETRATILGHIQRGGIPVAHDRFLASSMGVYAIELILRGYNDICIGYHNDKLIFYKIIDIINLKRRRLDSNIIETLKKLS